jgi:hypothetical protein
MLVLQVGKAVVAAGDRVPAGVLLANAHVFPPSPDVASNPHDHGTPAIGANIAEVRLGWNMSVIVNESVR